MPYSLLAKAIPVLRSLRLAGHEAHIVGGWCRDVVHGVQPKDIDIVVLCKGEGDDVAIDHNADNEADELWTSYDGVACDWTDMVAVMKYGPVDVIFYNQNTLQEVLDIFDCNLNQYWFNEELNRCEFLGQQEKTYVQTKRDRLIPPDRVKYMQDKARDLAWDVPDVENPNKHYTNPFDELCGV